MRSLSVGVAGVLVSGAVLTSATVATANSADTAPVAPQGEATLAAYEFSAPQSLVSTWGAPEVVVPSVDLKAEAAKKAEADRVAAEQKAANEAAAKAEKSAQQVQVLSTDGATAEFTDAPEGEVKVESTTPVVTQPDTTIPTSPVAGGGSSVDPGVKDQPSTPIGSNSAKRNAVVGAAQSYASSNAQTDCTALVSNSLAAIGLNFHGWPTDYQSLGTIVGASEAQPGDLIYYASNGFGSSHIAVYIGNGQAVHGGWNGMGTSVFSVNLPNASAPIFISPSAYN